MKRLVALYRRPSYSPLQHRTNDTAILEATAAELSHAGWDVTGATESDVEGGRLPGADLYLNMCQGTKASERLSAVGVGSARVVNGLKIVARVPLALYVCEKSPERSAAVGSDTSVLDGVPRRRPS